MKKRFCIFLALAASLVMIFTWWGTSAKTNNISDAYFHSFTLRGNHHHSSVNNPIKRPNTDRFKIRLKADVDSWEISLPAEWHYNPPIFFTSEEEHHTRYNRNEFVTLLIVTALRGPPAVYMISPMITA